MTEGPSLSNGLRANGPVANGPVANGNGAETAEANGAAAPPADMTAAAPIVAHVRAAMQEMVARLSAEHRQYGLTILCLAAQICAIELRPVDRKGCGAFLRALADLMDPPAAKLRRKGVNAFLTGAEERRRAAVQTLFEGFKRTDAYQAAQNRAAQNAAASDESSGQSSGKEEGQ